VRDWRRLLSEQEDEEAVAALLSGEIRIKDVAQSVEPST